jgi:hypothetical protein
VLIGWDYGASGIWPVTTKEEMEAPAPSGQWTGIAPQGRGNRPRPWSELLPAGLLDELQAWNDAWEEDGQDENDGTRTLQERGRMLAIRVQNELGTDGWEVLYQAGDRMHRVHPPESWPLASWEQELLGYSRP